MDPPYENRIWYLYDQLQMDPSLMESVSSTDHIKSNVPVSNIPDMLDNMEKDSLLLMLYQGTMADRIELIYGLLEQEFRHVPSIRGHTGMEWFTRMLLGPAEGSIPQKDKRRQMQSIFSKHHKEEPTRLLNTLALCHDMYKSIYVIHLLPNASKLVEHRRMHTTDSSQKCASLVDWAAVWDGIRVMGAQLEQSCSDPNDDNNDRDNDDEKNDETNSNNENDEAGVYFFNYVHVSGIDTKCVFYYERLLRYLAQAQNIESFFETITWYMGSSFLSFVDTMDTAQSILTSSVGSSKQNSGTETMTMMQSLYYHCATTVLTFYYQLQGLFHTKQLHRIFKYGDKHSSRTIRRCRLKDSTQRVLSGLGMCLHKYIHDDLPSHALDVQLTENDHKDDDDETTVLTNVIDWDRILREIHTLESMSITNEYPFNDNQDGEVDGETDSDADLHVDNLYVRAYNTPMNSKPISQRTGCLDAQCLDSMISYQTKGHSQFGHFCRRLMHWKIAYLVHMVYLHSLSYWSNVLSQLVSDYRTENRSLYDRLMTSAIICHDSVIKRKRKYRGDISDHILTWGHFYHTLEWCSKQSDGMHTSQASLASLPTTTRNTDWNVDLNAFAVQYQSPGIAMQSYRWQQVVRMLPYRSQSLALPLSESEMYSSVSSPRVSHILHDCIQYFKYNHEALQQMLLESDTACVNELTRLQGTHAKHIPLLLYPHSKQSNWIWSALSCFHYIRYGKFVHRNVKKSYAKDGQTDVHIQLIRHLMHYVFFQSDLPVFINNRETNTLNADDASTTDDETDFESVEDDNNNDERDDDENTYDDDSISSDNDGNTDDKQSSHCDTEDGEQESQSSFSVSSTVDEKTDDVHSKMEFERIDDIMQHDRNQAADDSVHL